MNRIGMDNTLIQRLRLLQLSDSALPVGGFSFSNTLESAVAYGVVNDAPSLEEFVRVALQTTSTTDCVAARIAYEASLAGQLDMVARADEELLLRKLNAEQRQMTLRMGRKMAELAEGVMEDELLAEWLAMITSDEVAGTYAVTQGVVFAVCGVGYRELFASILYGTATMMLNAALRLMRLTHHSTQQILYRLWEDVEALYEHSTGLGIEDMYGFAPQIDLLSALHEKGRSRMFMN